MGYTSDIFMGGKNTIVMHNVCEDSLLAAPLILDLVLLAELITRIELRKDGEKFHSFNPIAVLLSYLTKAPLVPSGTPCVNALAKQRAISRTSSVLAWVLRQRTTCCLSTSKLCICTVHAPCGEEA